MNNIYCTASIVIYKNPPEMIRKAAESFLNTSLNVKLYIIDNSPTADLQTTFKGLPVEYHFYGENVGYGRAHSWGIERVNTSRYYLILNPDVVIHKGVIEKLSQFMDSNPDIGMVCPKVLNEDGSIQPLNKRYPTVFDLFVRRFLPKRLHRLLKKRLAWYETRDIGYETIHDVEFMTGCFMFCRTSVLKAVGSFDERYFLNFEDCDLGRKFQNAGYRTVYYPHVAITHLWGRASHKSIKMTWVFIVNMVRYFNKWGWKLF
jgi:hypothetical protein